MTQHPTQSPQFFLTAPSPCPYVEGQFERKVFTHLVGDRAPEMNDLLTQGGFRRSQNIAYRPACETCRACISVRILAGEFRPTRNMRKVMQRNADLKSHEGGGPRDIPAIKGDPEFAAHVARVMVANEFDLSYFQGKNLDHGAFSPLSVMVDHDKENGWAVKLLPVVCGVLTVPLPSARRFWT